MSKVRVINTADRASIILAWVAIFGQQINIRPKDIIPIVHDTIKSYVAEIARTRTCKLFGLTGPIGCALIGDRAIETRAVINRNFFIPVPLKSKVTKQYAPKIPTLKGQQC